MDPTIIDITAFREMKEIADISFAKELFDLFKTDTPERIAEMRQALTKNDIKVFSRSVHSVKGSSAVVGAKKLRDTCFMIEAKVKSSASIAGMDVLVVQLENDFNLSVNEIAKEL